MKIIESTRYYKKGNKNKEILESAIATIEKNGFNYIDHWVEDNTLKIKYDDLLESGGVYVERKPSVFEKNNKVEKLKSFLLMVGVILFTALLAGLAAYGYLLVLISENQ
ncbi:hypothetical protein [Carnobacterium divergens]|uniref:hypothetical protein n=1 Tax=Carnobacterium divergens TaxID=2748 RepID=UPI00288F2941|nr:hypothetical protein [Carnobacterium divergens]MDT2012604.1 hypothetical protein [Carnobacterium divergens]